MTELTPEESLDRAKEIQKQYRAKAKEAESSRNEVRYGLLVAVVAVLGWNFMTSDSGEAESATTPTAAPTCSNDDAACLGAKHLAAIQQPCTQAIEGLLQFQPEWTQGLLEQRFNAPTWYEPPSTIIFTGNHLLVSNAFGAKQRVSYFCVVSAQSGALENAGIPSLEARLSPR